MLYKLLVKRLIDILISSLVLILVSPVLLLVFVLLFIVNEGKALFIQTRPGRKEKNFNIIKFKTMNDKRNADGTLLPDGERLTPIGKIVRKTSIDELPQLINVLKGEMSLVGPRPLLVEYLKLYNQEQRRRHEVRPGITGWAQVNGRNTIDWQQKFEFDIWYVDNISLGLDIKILYSTFLKVFKSEGISQNGKATVEPFRGNIEL
ncbi:Sugar transferase involved in LPS biosynthesis (colanic, teichoic acid) [Pseudarcicella hirudinis]|uniref:Sugar transferase involved in LPS biosynthesis (Colanic, teichoic acid) n=1 Tax=Pseudarcicella hirudinis TaxID=1079859 RepID=A0A1I5VS32_9BACT|nr:sugar transferase [Pseudarcicella hirudinis]SFQ10378.1 Sugar transferase involved in LPS biosynthesis (colanic, teichoic acid) [Pseudarcicella hirudinis]